MREMDRLGSLYEPGGFVLANELGSIGNLIVSEMLGHASIAITLDTYSHVLPTMQEAAICALEDALTQ